MIIIERPPNFAQILAAFPNADKAGVIFAYDGNIYNPSGGNIPSALLAHENVHLERQQLLGPHAGSTTQWSGPDLWWQRYMEDSEFRYNEELLAHVAEFKAQNLQIKDRNIRANLLWRTAMRLTAPLYNYKPPRTMPEALRDLRKMEADK